MNDILYFLILTLQKTDVNANICQFQFLTQPKWQTLNYQNFFNFCVTDLKFVSIHRKSYVDFIDVRI